MKSGVNRVLNFIEKICLGGSSVSILLIMFLTTFDLLARKLIDYSIPSLYELTEDYLMVSLVFLSMSYVYSIGGHVRVTLFERYIPPGIKKPLERILLLGGLILFAFITLKGWQVTLRAFEFQEVSNSVLAYPLAPAFFLVPLGCALLCLRILQSIFSANPMPVMHGPSLD
jgi:TRAP-type C4-dicarboxylate transport system permease small subunit